MCKCLPTGSHFVLPAAVRQVAGSLQPAHPLLMHLHHSHNWRLKCKPLCPPHQALLLALQTKKCFEMAYARSPLCRHPPPPPPEPKWDIMIEEPAMGDVSNTSDHCWFASQWLFRASGRDTSFSLRMCSIEVEMITEAEAGLSASSCHVLHPRITAPSTPAWPSLAARTFI